MYEMGGRRPSGWLTNSLPIPEVFWHARPPLFWGEVVHSHCLGAVIDLGANDGSLALVCARDFQIPYLGLCLTEKHATDLRTQLIKTAMEETLKEADKRYDPNLAKALKSFSTRKSAAADTAAVDNDQPKTKKPHGAEDGTGADPGGKPEAKKDHNDNEKDQKRA